MQAVPRKLQLATLSFVILLIYQCSTVSLLSPGTVNFKMSLAGFGEAGCTCAALRFCYLKGLYNMPQA